MYELTHHAEVTERNLVMFFAYGFLMAILFIRLSKRYEKKTGVTWIIIRQGCKTVCKNWGFQSKLPAVLF